MLCATVDSCQEQVPSPKSIKPTSGEDAWHAELMAIAMFFPDWVITWVCPGIGQPLVVGGTGHSIALRCLAIDES